MVRDLTTPSRIMQRNRVPQTIFAIALSACVVEPELLNSERIKQRYGSYGIDVFESNNELRRSNLHSIENGKKVCRTYAVVRFDNAVANVIGAEHAQILNGGSIGATFRANGWAIYKETRHVGDLRLADSSPYLQQLMALQEAASVAMHIYRLLLKKESQIVDYATIIELHHPDYLSSEDVARLYVVDEPARLGNDELQEMSSLALQSR